MKTKTIITKSGERFPGYVPPEEIKVGLRLYFVDVARHVTPMVVEETCMPGDGEVYRWAEYLVKFSSRKEISTWATLEHAQAWQQYLNSIFTDVILED